MYQLGFAVGFMVLFFPSLVDASTINPDTVIKAAGNPNVYYVAMNGKRYRFPDPVTYSTWYDSFGVVKEVTPDVFKQIPDGVAPITSRPGARLIAFNGSNRVYVVLSGAFIRWVKKEKIAEQIYGKNWQQQIVQIPLDQVTQYVIAQPINNAAEYNAFLEREKNGDKRIRIGDPNNTIHGPHHYQISYIVERAILSEENLDRLYWNAIGNNWEVPIESAEVRVHIPESIGIENINFTCHTGYKGEKGKCMYKKEGDTIISSVMTAEDPSILTPGHAYSYTVLYPGMGFTVEISLPKGLIEHPSTLLNIKFFLEDNWPLGIPLVVATVLFSLWYLRGRDPQGRGTIIHEYTPPKGLSPSQVGTIFDESVHNYDISADLIQLAIEGFIRFKKDDKGYSIEKRKDFASIPHDFQKQLLTSLFSVAATQKKKNVEELQEVRLDSVKKHFSTEFEKVKDKIYHTMVESGYFLKNPEGVRRSYYFIGVAMLVAAFWMLGPFTLPAVMIGISGILFLIFGTIMPAKTLKGVHLREYVLGLKTYIEVAEKDRIKFHNAPEKSPEYFEKLLPYAMVLGVEKQWAKYFEGIYTQPPEWYQGYSRTFLLNSFVHDLGNFSSTVDQSLSAAPQSSSGGGFSGGGFGGGGGGSW